MARMTDAIAGLPGLMRSPARLRLGMATFMSSSRFAQSSSQKNDDPVMFPPGLG